SLSSLRRGVHVKLVQNGFQELFARQCRVDDDGSLDLVLHSRISIQKVERGVEKSGLAGSDVASQQNEAFAVKNSAGDAPQGFVSVSGPMDIARVGREAERVLT